MKRFLLLLSASLCACLSEAQVYFTAALTGNPVNTAGWTFPTGTSYVSGNSFVLTNPAATQAGYIYYSTPTTLVTCAEFTVDFEFQITNSSAPPADGLTFWYISNPPSAFVAGGGIGLPNNPNGLVLIFDTYDNNSTPDNPLITLRGMDGTANYVEGNGFGQLGNIITSQSNLLNGNWHSVHLTYSNGTVNVYMNGATTPTISANYPLNINGYFGFSAGTGALWSKHSIRNVNISATLPPPAPVFASDTVRYCRNDISVPLAATGTKLQWYTSPTGGTADTIAPVPSTATAGTTIWYVSSKGSNGCESGRIPVPVTIYPPADLPAGDTIVNYCIGSPIQPWNITGANLKWYAAATGGSPIATPTVSTAALGSWTYWVSQTVNGCEGARRKVVVTVFLKPPPPVVQTPVRYCTGATATPLTTTNGTNVRWYLNATGGTGGSFGPVPPTSLEDTISYWVSQVAGNCESIRTRVDVYVYTQPTAKIVATDTVICQEERIDLSYQGNALTTDLYDWHVPAFKGTILSGGGQGPVSVQFDSAGTFPVRLQVSHMGCASDEAILNVRVKQLPMVKLAPLRNGCVGVPLTVALQDASLGIDSFLWNWGGGTAVYSSYPEGPHGVRYASAGRYIISSVAMAAGCASHPSTDTIDIQALPNARFGMLNRPGTFCLGDTVLLQSEARIDAYTYRWGPLAFNTGLRPDFDYQAYQSIRKEGYVTMNVTDTFGCTNTDSILLAPKACCEIFIPTAFSPNRDGRNDYFHIITDGNSEVLNFRVMNRWGQPVFETADRRAKWDGTFHGQDQPIGTYFYYIRHRCPNGQVMDEKGEVALIR